MKLYRLTLLTAVLAVVFTLIGCDEDFSEVGGEIINNPTDVILQESAVNSYTKKLNSVQTNNLSNLFLGTYNDETFGESSASIVTQTILGTQDPNFGDNTVLDSVVLTLPYYSNTSTNTNGETVYELDSVYGSGSFHLSVYESSYFLNNYDPESNFQSTQKYYSDQREGVESNILQKIYENANFSPSKEPYSTYENDGGVIDTVENAPALRIKLDKEYFVSRIIDKEGGEELLNNSNFQNYFRSIYLKAESNDSEGSEILFNMSDENAGIKLYYSFERLVDEEKSNEQGVLDLNFTNSNHFNLYDGEFPTEVSEAIAAQDSVSGASSLFLKGQEGSMAVIELFKDPAVLTELKENLPLINEANLKFYLDENYSSSNIPYRITVYDLQNYSVLADYANDFTINENNPLNSRTVFSSKLITEEDSEGKFFKVRITRHIANMLNNDRENAKLGLVVTGNINSSSFSAVRNVEDVARIPAGSIIEPRGLVLYGNNAEEGKRLKLQIYYTEY